MLQQNCQDESVVHAEFKKAHGINNATANQLEHLQHELNQCLEGKSEMAEKIKRLEGKHA